VIINQAYSGWKGPVFGQVMPSQQPKPISKCHSLSSIPSIKIFLKKIRIPKCGIIFGPLCSMSKRAMSTSGDVNTDWDLCNNKVRAWYHIPYHTYDPMSGREFIHGLTREAPVTMAVKDQGDIKTTMWAVGFYNPQAANSIAKVWTGAAVPVMLQTNFAFNEGSVIGKLLFTTATPNIYLFLEHMPVWQAKIRAC